MARRSGLPTIDKLAYGLCRLVTKFQTIILEVYPDADALHAALAAALVACAALRAEISAVLPIGD